MGQGTKKCHRKVAGSKNRGFTKTGEVRGESKRRKRRDIRNPSHWVDNAELKMMHAPMLPRSLTLDYGNISYCLPWMNNSIKEGKIIVSPISAVKDVSALMPSQPPLPAGTIETALNTASGTGLPFRPSAHKDGLSRGTLKGITLTAIHPKVFDPHKLKKGYLVWKGDPNSDFEWDIRSPLVWK